MSDLGDIGRVSGRGGRASRVSFAGRAQAVITGSGAEPGAAIVILLRTACVAATRADDAGDWLVGGLNDGTYWATEVGTLSAWLVEVAGPTVTVTPQTGGGGGGEVVAAYSWVFGE